MKDLFNYYIKNCVYLKILILEMKKDYKNINLYFYNLFSLNFLWNRYYKNINKLIFDLVLFILFISPILWIIKWIIFFYKKVFNYIFMFLDIIFLDIIFFDNGNMCYYYLKIKSLFYFLMFTFWFEILVKYAFKLRNFYSLENIILRLIKRISYFIKFWVKSLEYLIKFIVYLYCFIRWIVKKLWNFLIYIYLLWFKFKNEFIRLKILFFWYLKKLPKWFYNWIKKKIKNFFRWFRRWNKIFFVWLFKINKFLFIGLIKRIIFYSFRLFNKEWNCNKIYDLNMRVGLIYRFIIWNIDLYVIINLKKLYNFFIFKLIKCFIVIYHKYFIIYHKYFIFKSNVLILICKFKIYFVLIIDKIFCLLLPVKLKYFIDFCLISFYNKLFKNKVEKNLIDRRIDALTKRYKYYSIKDFNEFGKKLYMNCTVHTRILTIDQYPLIKDKKTIYFYIDKLIKIYCFFINLFYFSLFLFFYIVCILLIIKYIIKFIYYFSIFCEVILTLSYV